jgi:hypothetical protein
MDETPKTINITGVNNRYMMKKLIKNHKEESENKKRIVSQKWTFSKEQYEYNHQMNIINDIYNNKYNNDDEVIKTTIQEIKRKISSYKQQDIIKKHWDEVNFLTLNCILTKMIECELKCRYCNCEMYVLYDISRETKQWSVDRIDNNIGHTNNNFHLACLDCNLKRRRRSDEKFLFTKQLIIVKQDL